MKAELSSADMYIDVHCHLTGDEYDEVGGVTAVLERAKADGVTRIVCSGFDLSSSIQACALAEQFPQVYFSAGFHPSELNKYQDGDWEKLSALFSHEKCVAVGEIGLDYHFDDNPPKEFQRACFIKQLELANTAKLPVVIHSRDSAQETYEILTEHKALLNHGGLLHCYSYSPEMSERFLELDLYFSFGGTSTFKNAKKVFESVQRVPATRILSETDCPYLTPTPYRGEFPNEPKHIPIIVKRLAELRDVSETEMKETVLANAKRLFAKLK